MESLEMRKFFRGSPMAYFYMSPLSRVRLYSGSRGSFELQFLFFSAQLGSCGFRPIFLLCFTPPPPPPQTAKSLKGKCEGNLEFTHCISHFSRILVPKILAALVTPCLHITSLRQKLPVVPRGEREECVYMCVCVNLHMPQQFKVAGHFKSLEIQS